MAQWIKRKLNRGYSRDTEDDDVPAQIQYVLEGLAPITNWCGRMSENEQYFASAEARRNPDSDYITKTFLQLDEVVNLVKEAKARVKDLQKMIHL